MLDRMENFETDEPSATSEYSIEHVMPQNKKLAVEWRRMLCEDWEQVQQTWLHRLGNLTLTAYNPKYSDRPFTEKKEIEHGFNESAVRLNKSVRDESVWTGKQVEARGKLLSKIALKIWSGNKVDQAELDAAEGEALQKRASRRNVADVPMTEKARGLYDALKPRILELSPEAIEIAESKSVSFHNPSFFLEVLPRKHRLLLLLPPDFAEVQDDSGIAIDATDRKFFANAKYDGGTVVRINEHAEIDAAIGIVRQAMSLVTD